MGAMSSKYNDTPATASRPYDVNRDGFVIAGGAGVLVLEELEHAKARGAKIYGEIVGYGATSDGYDMVAPSGEGAERCMQMALATTNGIKIDYINPHATSTPAGDAPEITAIRNVFGAGDKCPPISATKALTGHSLGATGVQEAIYSLLMMQNGFICESAHITELDPAFADMPIVRKRIDNAKIGAVLSNSFGFGGTNATLVFKRLEASVRYLACDLGPKGIRVNAVSAGPVRTLAGSGIGDSRAMFGFMEKHSPLGRGVTLEELGGSALYLLSDLSGGVTGETHYVDSGYNIVLMPKPDALKGDAEK